MITLDRTAIHGQIRLFLYNSLCKQLENILEPKYKPTTKVCVTYWLIVSKCNSAKNSSSIFITTNSR